MLINLDKLSIMYISGYLRDVPTEIAVVETLGKHLSTDAVLKSADAVKAQAN